MYASGALPMTETRGLRLQSNDTIDASGTITSPMTGLATRPVSSTHRQPIDILTGEGSYSAEVAATWPSRYVHSRSPPNAPARCTALPSHTAPSAPPVSASPNAWTCQQNPEASRLIEIPRFKKRELNLAIVQGPGHWRAAWIALWICWLTNGGLNVFFDVNITFILVQCVNHPSSDSSSRNWEFALVSYCICWASSTFVVWIGWEVWFEYWRRWRSSRPAIEPIYLSLPATIHLALGSFHHFAFLAYIRLSPLGTSRARDVVSETCYSLVQLLPGTILLLPRAAIAVVLLASYGRKEEAVAASSRISNTRSKDLRYFRSDTRLTSYAIGILYSFVTWIGVRLVVIIASIVLLWLFSDHPLGGLVRSRVRGPVSLALKVTSTYRRRDPHHTPFPQKSWRTAEQEVKWAWKDRTRSRIQDAFELCMMRPHSGLAPDALMGSTEPCLTVNPSMTSSPVVTPYGAQTSRPLTRNNRPHPSRSARQQPTSLTMPIQSINLSLRSPSPLRSVDTDLSGLTSSWAQRPEPHGTKRSVTFAITEFGAFHSNPETGSHTFRESEALSTPNARNQSRTQGDILPALGLALHSESKSTHVNRVLSRARSTSFSSLRQNSDRGFVRRVRSGTLLRTESKYLHLSDERLPPPETLCQRSEITRAQDWTK